MNIKKQLFAVLFFTSFACFGQQSYPFDLTIPTPCPISGIEELENKPEMYPNPVHDFLTVKLTEQSGFFSCFDIQGKLQQSHFLVQGTQQLDLQHLPKGLYFAVIQTESYLYTTKITIE